MSGGIGARLLGWRRPRTVVDVAAVAAGAVVATAWLWTAAGTRVLPLLAAAAAAAAAGWVYRHRPVLAAQVVIAAAGTTAPGLAVLLAPAWQSGQTATLVIAGFIVAGPMPTLLGAGTRAANPVLAGLSGTGALLAALVAATVLGPQRTGPLALLAGVSAAAVAVWVHTRRGGHHDVGENAGSDGHSRIVLPAGWSDHGLLELGGPGRCQVLTGPVQAVVVAYATGRPRARQLAATAAAGHTAARVLHRPPGQVQPVLCTPAGGGVRRYRLTDRRGGVVIAARRSHLGQVVADYAAAHEASRPTSASRSAA